jgi:hypothetical protein
MNQTGGFRGNGHPWAGMGASSLRDAPPLCLLLEMGLAPSAKTRQAASLQVTSTTFESIKANEYRLRLKPDTPRFLYAALNRIF